MIFDKKEAERLLDIISPNRKIFGILAEYASPAWLKGMPTLPDVYSNASKLQRTGLFEIFRFVERTGVGRTYDKPEQANYTEQVRTQLSKEKMRELVLSWAKDGIVDEKDLRKRLKDLGMKSVHRPWLRQWIAEVPVGGKRKGRGRPRKYSAGNSA